MTPRPTDSRRRAFWLKTLHEWHWVSSALCLIGMLLFALTGFTLNHASQIEASPKRVQKEARLSPELLSQLQAAANAANNSQATGQGHQRVASATAKTPTKTPITPAPLPQPVQAWALAELGVNTEGRTPDWSADEVYVSLPRPGGDAWLRIDLQEGEAEYENTDRGWISYFNDLHKGRHTGVAWSWFIDIFAAACLVFTFTGLFILQMHAGRRPFTWPMVGMGLVIPVVLALLFIH